MSKHTPGPWTLETLRTSSGLCHKIGPFPRTTVSDVVGHACIYVDYPGTGPREAELLANASLIAAAPDLLDALQWLLGATAGTESHRYSYEAHDSAVSKARAAIAKATQGAET